MFIMFFFLKKKNLFLITNAERLYLSVVSKCRKTFKTLCHVTLLLSYSLTFSNIPQIISYSLTYSNSMDKICSIHTTFLNRQLHGGLCPATKHISLITTDKRRTGSGQTVLCSLVTPKTMNTRTLIERQVPREVSMPAKFGMFGGNFVPETLITSLKKLEAEFIYALQDTEFQVCCHFIFFLLLYIFFAMLDMIFTNLE